MLLTSGDSITTENGIYHLPKREIINSLLYVLDHEQLKIPNDLPTKEALLNQAASFIRTFTESGRKKMESATESIHDDLIISLGHGCWFSLMPGRQMCAVSLFGSVAQATEEYPVSPASEMDKVVESFQTAWKKTGY